MYQKSLESPVINQSNTNSLVSEYVSVFAKSLPQKKQNATLCVFISVGTEHCSGTQLKSSLQLLNKTFHYSHVVFVVADTLQRFTHQLQGIEDEQTAKQKAINEGLIWKDQHKNLIEKELTHLTYNFIHWSELVESNEYPTCKEKIGEAYEKNNEFKQKFNKTANGFLSAWTYKVDNTQAMEICLDYLKEECAVHLVLAEKKIDQNKIDYSVYTRTMSDAFSATYETFMKQDVLVYLTIKNKSVKQEKLLYDTKNKKERGLACNSNAFFKSESKQSNPKLPTPVSHANSQTNLLTLRTYMTFFKTILESTAIPNNEQKINLLLETIANMEKLLGGGIDDKLTANLKL